MGCIPEDIAELRNRLGVLEASLYLGGRGVVPEIDMTGVDDSYSNIMRASDQAGEYGTVIFPPGSIVRCDQELEMKNGQRWIGNHTRLRHNIVSRKFMRAMSVKDFIFEGFFLEGFGYDITALNVGERALRVYNCDNYTIQHLHIINFQGEAIVVDGEGNLGSRGNQGSWADIVVRGCFLGANVKAGAGGEYDLWNRMRFGGNITDLIDAAGNNVWDTCNFVDSTNGVLLRGGPNHVHSIFGSCQINHHASVEVDAEDIENGATFVGCHIYRNPSSIIWLKNSKNIQFLGGKMDVPFWNDSGPLSGENQVAHVNMPGTAMSWNSNNSGLSQLSRLSNFGPGVPA